MSHVHPLSRKKIKSLPPLQHSKMSSQSNKSNLRQSSLERTLTSSKAALSRRSQCWIRTDRWAIGAQRSSTYIAVALLFNFFMDCCFNHMAAWKVLHSFIDEVCTKLDFVPFGLETSDRRKLANCLSSCKETNKIIHFLFLWFLVWPYKKHLINRAMSVFMGESWTRSLVQTSLRSVCTGDLPLD